MAVSELKYLLEVKKYFSEYLHMFIIFIWKWQFTPVFLSGKFHGQRSLVGCNPWGHKESDRTERLGTEILQKESR